ncbi:hypothetical protein ACETU7_06555 [Rhodococcus sp. 3Y1]
MTSILKDWQQIPTVEGKRWHRQTVKKILQAPRNAAIRTYRGRSCRWELGTHREP